MQITLMLCGPHAGREWSPLYHRVDAARDVARHAITPVLVAGDIYNGRAVRHFADYLRNADVRSIEAFDPGGRTLTDAQAALRAIRDRSDLAFVREVLVVTDDWHAARALAMLGGEAKQIVANRNLSFVDASTPHGPRPPDEVLAGERRGIVDYLAGNPYRPFGQPYGKPCHPTEYKGESG